MHNSPFTMSDITGITSYLVGINISAKCNLVSGILWVYQRVVTACSYNKHIMELIDSLQWLSGATGISAK